MSKQTDTSLFIVSSLPRLYQVLFSGIEDYKVLGCRIVKEIKLAHAFRQTERVRELASILINTPIKEHKLIARYYLVWCECRRQNFQSLTLERIIEQTQTYKAQALLTRGTFDVYQGRPESALHFYNEALIYSCNLPEFISVSLAISQLKGIEGFNESALRDLEYLAPFLKHADARLYYGFLNSYAFELGRVGRKYEARNVIRHVLASPFINAYPEWRETADELQSPNRSFAVLNPTRQRMGKILSMPVIEPAESVEQDRPARILNLEEWKKKMVKDDPQEKPNEKQMVVQLMNLLTSDRVTYDQLCKIMAYAEKVASEPEGEQ